MGLSVEQLEHLALTEDQETRLKIHLASVLDQAEAERSGFVDGLKEEIEAYEAPKRPEKAFPWRGAANLTVPVIGSMVDTVFPRLHATIYGASTYVTIEEWPADLANHAKAWQDYLQWSLEHELEIERLSDSWFMEAIIHGTSVVKVTWERLEREYLEYDNRGKIRTSRRELLRNQPVLTHVPLQDFYIPFTAKSIRDAEWVAHRIRTSWGELKLREANGLYKNVDDIQYITEIASDEYTAKRQEIEDTEPSFVDDHEVFEVWLDFDLDNDGAYKPFLVTYHRDSGTLLRVQPNPYNHRRKPFREIVYFPRHDRFFGFGLARQLLPIQEEISTIHNQRLDNATIANTRMWKVVAGSRADQSFQGAAPGLKILVDDPTEIDGLQLGDVTESSFENERVALQYAQQRGGVSDFLQGIDFGKGGGRQTATQTVAMMQEARTRFNWTLEQCRDAIADVASMVTDLYQQFGADDDDKFEAVLGERAELVGEFLGNDVGAGSTLSASLSLQVTASSASSNKAIENQNLLALMQMLQQITMQFEMPLIQMVLNPGIPQQLKDYALEKIEGSRALFRRIMETSDVRNAAEILGSMENFATQGAPAAQPVPVSGAAPGAAPANAGTGMGMPGGAMAGPMGGGGF